MVRVKTISYKKVDPTKTLEEDKSRAESSNQHRRKQPARGAKESSPEIYVQAKGESSGVINNSELFFLWCMKKGIGCKLAAELDKDESDNQEGDAWVGISGRAEILIQLKEIKAKLVEDMQKTVGHSLLRMEKKHEKMEQDISSMNHSMSNFIDRFESVKDDIYDVHAMITSLRDHFGVHTA
ncbi:conserved hypothetical protein [Ricinus communis]|uniref:Uncharacterized protein n=1 Tax=Ricinus communis TaxID=3988 RepID=B9SZX4_RICCO|nr:conserved hypothetical protein [Ricinus communis]